MAEWRDFLVERFGAMLAGVRVFSSSVNAERLEVALRPNFA